MKRDYILVKMDKLLNDRITCISCISLRKIRAFVILSRVGGGLLDWMVGFIIRSVSGYN